MPSNLNNNTTATATQVLITGKVPYELPGGGALSSATGGDLVDYYSFTTATTSNLDVSIEGLSGNADLKVFRLTGTTRTDLVSNRGIAGTSTSSVTNTGKLSESFIYNGLDAGTYYIEVKLATGATDATYGIKALASTGGSENSIVWKAPGFNNTEFWKMSGLAYQETALELPGYEIAGLGDLDGDKTTDVIWREATGAAPSRFAIWLMRPDNTVKQTEFLGNGGAIAFDAEIVLAGVEDISGDGKEDLIFRNINPAKGYAYFWEMDGVVNTNQTNYVFDFLRGYDIAGFGDFNGDNKKDIVWRNSRFGGGSVAVWLMNGGQALETREITQSATPNFQLKGIKNVNANVGGSTISALADKTDDLVWYDANTGQASVWLMNGTQLKQSSNIAIPIPNSYFIAGVEDVNGDGNGDILWRAEGTVTTASGTQLAGAVGVWLLDTANTGSLLKAAEFAERPIGGQYKVTGFADFNGDGATDILWRNANSQATGDLLYDSIAVWIMGGGQSGTSSKTENFLTKDGTPMPFIDGVNFTFEQFLTRLERFPAAVQAPGFVSTQFASADQTTAGPTPLTAFNLGVLEGTGNYQDFVIGSALDYYTFKVDPNRSVKPTFSLTNGFGSTTAATAELKLFRNTGTNPDGTPALTPISTIPATLAPGVYYIEVKSTAPAATLVNYNLNVTGVPITVNLLGTNVTVKNSAGSATAVDLVNVVSTNPDETQRERTSVTLDYSIQNTEASNSGPVKVRFYLSRDAIIDTSVDRLIAETTVNNPGPGGVNQGVPANGIFSGSVAAVLPPGDSVFWTTDRDYFVGMVIDPTSEGLPVGELAETVETDNLNRGLDLDVDAISITNTQVPDLLMTAISANGTTLTPGGSVTVNYTIKNQGKKATGSINSDINIDFYVYAAEPDTPETALLNPTAAVKITPVGYVLTANLATNGTANGTATLTLPSANSTFWTNIAPGTAVYIATLIDTAETFPESDELNNSNLGANIDRVRFTRA